MIQKVYDEYICMSANTIKMLKDMVERIDVRPLQVFFVWLDVSTISRKMTRPVKLIADTPC